MSNRKKASVGNRNKLVGIAFALFGITGFCGSYWLVYWKSKNNHIDASQALPASAQYRGQYIRSGSKDVGPDPDAPNRYGWKEVKKVVKEDTVS